MNKRTVIGIWIAIILGLIILGNTMPTIKNLTEEKDYTYKHPKDNYTMNIAGYWQVYNEAKQKLTLIDTKNDCTVSIHLEVGGYDYLTPQESADKLIRSIKEQFRNFNVINGPTEGTVNGYNAVAFLAKYKKGDAVYYNESAILHPNEGIRIYTTFIYPKGTDKNVIKNTETMLNTIQFKETEELYAKYM